MNKYTGDVVVMGLMTDNVDDAVEWMLEDCPKTPKIVIADAETSSDPAQIRRKIHQMEAAMLAYSVGHTPIVGLVIGANLIVYASVMKGDSIEPYAPLDGRDLSDLMDVIGTMKELNCFIHTNSVSMTKEMRSSFPIVRSRSASVCSSTDSSSRPRYNLRNKHI